MRLVIPPPVLAAAAAVAQRALAGPPPPPSTVRAVAAAALGVASASMSVGAIRTFFATGTTVEPFHPEEATVLVTSGPNAVSRNPMYVGLTGMLLAHALWRKSWVALVPVAGFVGYIDRVQIEAEEAALLANFGADYEAYRASTPRWVGPGSL